jgi:ferric-dicitrate binding protein FerR (iron transport regulator)
MSGGEQIPDDLIARYLAGEASPEEIQNIEDWAAESADNQAILDASKSLWDMNFDTPVPDLNTEAAWQKIKQRIQIDSPLESERIISMNNRKRNMTFIRIAAAVISVLVIGSVLYLIFNSRENISSFAAQTNPIRISLPDSSYVILEPGSELQFDRRDFNKNERRLQLNGSALFEVVRNESKPFCIKTPRSEVRVLGTSFKVSDYESNDTVFVKVITGKVRLSSGNNNALQKDLLAGEEGKFVSGDNQILKSRIQTEDLRYQLNKTIVFKETSLALVCQTLERIYKTEVRLANPNLDNCHLTASFSEQELPEIILIIANTFGLESEANNRGYIFKGKGCD